MEVKSTDRMVVFVDLGRSIISSRQRTTSIFTSIGLVHIEPGAINGTLIVLNASESMKFGSTLISFIITAGLASHHGKSETDGVTVIKTIAHTNTQAQRLMTRW